MSVTAIGLVVVLATVSLVGCGGEMTVAVRLSRETAFPPVPAQTGVASVQELGREAPLKAGRTYVFHKIGSREWSCEEVRVDALAQIPDKDGIRVEGFTDLCGHAASPEEVLKTVADIFGYGSDLPGRFRKGDRLLLYSEREDRTAGPGRVLAAEIEVRGERRQAFHFELPDGYAGYFDSAGESLNELFSKSPLDQGVISSKFSYMRLHPILGICRPHLGTDYAAPMGTPVRAVGAGEVVYEGWKGGFGMYVELRHAQNYVSGYGHLSRLADGLRKGNRVRESEVIGYVGESGLATGPHLDFRLYDNGEPVDFCKTKFPKRKVPDYLLSEFYSRQQFYLGALKGGKPFGGGSG
ncbi:MAG: peptidoglycan DD-metalloendopeptidase family protein [Syntrophobacteraceae bacterium]